MSHRSELVRQLVERGFLHQATDLEGLDALAVGQRITAYIGFDCTADSLHVGNLVGIMLLRLVQRTGHRPIALVGGGTTKVGDPSGKDESRQLLDDATLATYIAGVRRSLAAFLQFGDGPGDALLVNNDQWLRELRYIDFLREYGRHFTINRMLTFDSVRLRLDREQPLTFLEFNYMVMQAYDFLRAGAALRLPAADGRLRPVGQHRERRRAGAPGRRQKPVRRDHAADHDRDRRQDGQDRSRCRLAERATACRRSTTGSIWRNTADADVGHFLRLFTELPLDEIARLETLQGAELNEAKVLLANEATRLCRGEAAARDAASAARAMFVSGGDSAGLPTTEIARGEFLEGINVADLLCRAGLAASKGEARRLIRGGGARLNDARIDDEAMMVDAAHLQGDQLTLSAGRKRHVRVRVV